MSRPSFNSYTPHHCRIIFNALLRLKSVTKYAIDEKMRAIEYAFRSGHKDWEDEYKKEHVELQKQLEQTQYLIDSFKTVNKTELELNEWE